MSNYIVKNCPAREDIYEWTGDYYDAEKNKPIMQLDTPDYCTKHKKTCDKIADCELKKTLTDLRKIYADNDTPACYNAPGCPINGGCGFDNHCNEKCPLLIAKQVLNIWQTEEVQDAGQV